MSSQRWPSLISSDSLHFAALSLLFILPLSLFNIIHDLILQPSPSPFNTHQILPKLLYASALLIFNIFSVSAVTHIIFHAFHRNPIKLPSSLKSILPSFLTLLATKLAYFIVSVAISFGFRICIGVVMFGLIFLGLEIDPTTKPFMAVTVILFVALFVYLWVERCLMDVFVVVESKLVILQGIVSWRFSVLEGGARTSSGGYRGGAVLQLVVGAALSTVLTLLRHIYVK
ncbi:hypothetical protein AAHA92_18969 [Salvia divinorum]|uniref:Transmembrane protein n=1 Tax=Salvia divinorum TaxID=28513 RepID=A0ABD1H3T9_SALDI